MNGTIEEIEARILKAADNREKIDLVNELSWELRLSDPARGLGLAQQANAQAGELSYSKGLADSYCNAGTNCYFLSDYSQAIGELDKALRVYQEIDNKTGQALTLNWLGNTFYRLTDYSRTLQCHLQSLQLSRDIKDLNGESKSLHNIGNVYLILGDYENCLENYVQSVNIAEMLHNENVRAHGLCCIGLVYQNLGDYRKGLGYYLDAQKIFEKIGDSDGKMIAVNNAGDIYIMLKEYERALESYRISLKISEEIGEHFVGANSLHGMGKVYQQLKQDESAIEYFQRGLNFARERGDRETEQAILLSLGKYYRERCDMESSFRYLYQSLSIAEELKSRPKLSESYQELSESYSQNCEYPKALEYYQKYHDIDKELFNESSDKKRQATMIRFQVEQKEKEAEIYRLRNVELAEANQAITQAKETIEEKNRHITSSIEYARRIQQAVLPPAGKMQAALPEHFVLFKPRDIVSGDFYWFTQAGCKILIAVVDCTGHGVPGAFMSMIGSMLLNTIVNEQRITDPALILEQMHNEVRIALRQEQANSESTDGMDVCLCSIDGQNSRLTFAGAKRPLYIVSGSVLTEVKGDGKSIGGRQREERRSFSNSEIAIRKGDMIYLSSDGYTDQCDAEGLRIGSRRLKELLAGVAGNNPSAQREELLAELERHQGDEEQRDDIAVMGVRL